MKANILLDQIKAEGEIFITEELFEKLFPASFPDPIGRLAAWITGVNPPETREELLAVWLKKHHITHTESKSTLGFQIHHFMENKLTVYEWLEDFDDSTLPYEEFRDKLTDAVKEYNHKYNTEYDPHKTFLHYIRLRDKIDH